MARSTLTRGGWIVVVLAAALSFPELFPNPSVMTIAVTTLMYVGLASSWNMIGGFAGYISLGQSAFSGLGGYVLALLCEHLGVGAGYSPFALVPLIGVVVAIVSVPVGWAALRTRHAVFATVTIAVLFVVQLLAENLTGITGGSGGIGLPTPNWSPEFWNKPFYFALLIVDVAVVATAWLIRRSGIGLGLLALRDDEDKAEAIGVPTWRYKMTAFVVSAGFAAMIGAIYGYSLTYLYPQATVNPLIAMGAVLMPYLGGVGTLAGPVLGAVILVPAQLELSYYLTGQIYLVLYGAVFLAIIRFLPEGILPSVTELVRSRRSRNLRETDLLDLEPAPAPGPDTDAVPVSVAGPHAGAVEEPSWPR